MPFRRSAADLLVPLAMALSCSGTSAAQSVQNFCASAKAKMAQDGPLGAAAKAAFPNAGFATRDDDCLYPFKLLHYGDADTLVTIAGRPGEGCHGCGADVSAFVLRGAPARSTIAARFVDFTSTGFYGDPGQIDALQLAGHDALAIKSSGLFQGYSASQVSFFVFETGRLVALQPSLPLNADNSGAMTDARKAITVEGSWHVDPNRPDAVTIDYRVMAQRHERRSSATWVIQGGALRLRDGRVPPEAAAARGN